jgi:hypothetical protein
MLSRREFLASAIAAATIVDELQPQRRGAPLVLAGPQLAWHWDQRLHLWDLNARRHAARLPMSEPDVALGVAGETIIAAACDLSRSRARALLIESFRVRELSALSYYFAGADRVIAATPGEFWVTEPPRGLARYRVSDAVQRVGAIEWNQAQWLTATAAAERGCLLFYESGCIVRLLGSGELENFAVTRDSANPQHLAAGPRANTVWATTPEDLLLLSLHSQAAQIVARYRPAHPVYHLAAAGELAVLLTAAMRAGRWDLATLVAVDAVGRERWRRELPPPGEPEAWVAGSQSHVAICSGGLLAVFAARDGTAVII